MELQKTISATTLGSSGRFWLAACMGYCSVRPRRPTQFGHLWNRVGILVPPMVWVTACNAGHAALVLSLKRQRYGVSKMPNTSPRQIPGH